MITENDLLEPKKLYQESLKDSIIKNSEEYFRNLADKSGVDIAANAKTMEELKIEETNLTNIKKKASSKKSLRGFLIFCITVLFLGGILNLILGFKEASELWYLIIIGFVCIGGGIALAIVTHKKVTALIKDLNGQINRLNSEINELKNTGYMQLRALNDAYDFNMHVDIVNITVPLIKMDKYFDMEKYEYLVEKFGYKASRDNDESTVHIQSGSILGNPFVIETKKLMIMGTHTYEGSLTISYTVEVKTSDGYRTERRTQTLHAYVTKPKPYYNYKKWLYYGCEAAPDLSFSRSPVNGKKMSPKEMEKYLNKSEKELDKLVEKRVDKGFMPLGNHEFESLFHAWDRDNEVQFRLLFTPLAQRNLIDLIKNDGGYGDDFTFTKRKMLNIIEDEHNLTMDYVCEPDKFFDYNYENAKAKFVNYNASYFKSFWFDIAPLLSIPLYQQLPTDEYIFQHKFRNNVAPQEAESTVNVFDYDTFAPEDCETELILKSDFMGTEGIIDRLNVRSYGFATEEHVDYVPVKGNDGYWHDVPVHWIEYIPVHKETPAVIVRKEYSRQQIRDKIQTDDYRAFLSNRNISNNIVYRNGFFSFTTDGQEEYIRESDLDLLLKD